jgi:hypothetical protein
MAKVSGVVEASHQSKFEDDKWSMKVNGVYYNQKKKWLDCTPNSGDVVEFDNGGSKYIQNLRIVGAGEVPTASSSPKPRSVNSSPAGRTFPVGKSAPERTINRQNALTAAVNYCNDNHSPEQVIDIARMFEAYTTGDLDKSEEDMKREQLGIE